MDPAPSLLRSAHAPPPRTLLDIFRRTVQIHPEATAIDSGAVALTYAELDEAASKVADELAELGIGPGDRVGVRIRSGTDELYVAILGILSAGAAYVPVDADDPPERARTVFTQARVAAVIGNGLVITARDTSRPAQPRVEPTPHDDAWIIFTSGSTGAPKAVAVTHRSAAAFVDAEARLFLQDRPIGPRDRVMAGLSVAFDASCEEMWLAWRYGAALVPAPRSLVRSGVDLGPWLVANRITVISTVPTLVLLWPSAALAKVRLLILGGEACPPEIGARFATATRQVWNTYGPTEATVVACAAQLTSDGPVRIGLPLDGWDLAVVNAQGEPVGAGEVGELVIGGVGLARYLDPDKDAEKYAPLPSLGWQRAYRSGDLVRLEPEGLVFIGRSDDQVKVGGRRIELGEIDNALLALPGVVGAAAAVRTTSSGNRLLVGYLAVEDGFDPTICLDLLRRGLPAALVPRLAVVEELPTRTSGKIDRDALPWPLPESATAQQPALQLAGTQAWVRDLWFDILGAQARSTHDDFFDLGGGSLMAAELVSKLRARFPEVAVADVYLHPRLADLAAYLDTMASPSGRLNAPVNPVPRKTQRGQLAALIPLRTIAALRWLTWIGIGSNLASSWLGLDWAPTLSWWWIAAGWLLFVCAPGRILLAALGCRIILRNLAPGAYPRGGRVHLRVWLAERLADELGAANLAGAIGMRWYARLLGASVGRHVDLHAIPPVTGMLRLGDGASIEPEVDLCGHWQDGATFHVGSIDIGESARVGARTTLGPGTVIGDGAEIEAGSAVFGTVPAGQSWSGAPAQEVGPARGPWSADRPHNRPAWLLAYTASSLIVTALPILAVGVGLAVLAPHLRAASGLGDALGIAAAWLPLATLAGWVTLAAGVLVLTRLLSLGIAGGHYPVHGVHAWAAWSTMRLLDEARTWLFPLYSSALTPVWLRALGARIGAHVEASTVLLLPKLTTVNEGAFLADDTLLGGYEINGGWMRTERVKVGKHAFLGNSGMTAPGRRVPKRALVAVLSAAPGQGKAKAGSSWLGSPPERLRRTAGDVDAGRTYQPSTALRVARAAVELARIVPVLIGVGLYLLAVAALVFLASLGWWLAALAGGLVLTATGILAAALTTGAKWLLMGRLREGEHPLWSSFVWRNELADTFVEVIAAPWFARLTVGTAALTGWLRTLGAQIGRGVWCDTYWLPEPDLIRLHDGATVNRGCVVQTHLFHDRVLRLGPVTMHAGSTLGPNGVILPATILGRHATIGPASLVMRGESVPDKTRWIGNPIGPWVDDEEDGRGDDTAGK